MVVSDTKKAAKAQHRVREFAGPLVDHDALDQTDLRVIRSVNRRALNLVADFPRKNGEQGSSCF